MKQVDIEQRLLEVREGIYKSDLPNIKKQKENTTVNVKTYNYHDDGHPLHKLNVYRAKLNFEKSPVIIDIHGGGWFYGDKDTNGLFCMELAERGYIVISMSYRIIPEASVVDLVQDVFQAMNFIHELDQEYNMDLNNISIIGDSAGGHLAMLVCAFNNNPKYLSIYKVKPLKFLPNCCVAIHPAPYFHDPLKLDETKFERRKTLKNLAKIYFKNKAKNKKTVYAFFGDNYLSSFSKKLPLLVITSTADDVVGDQALKLKDYLTYNHYNFDFYNEENPSCGHVFNVTKPWQDSAKKCNNYLIKFIKNHQK